MNLRYQPMRLDKSSFWPGSFNSKHFWLLGIVLAATLVLGLAGCAPTGQPDAKAETSWTLATTAIPASQLENRYGLRVNLIAVTAAGGMVDLRLKVADAAKAVQLLGKQAPTLQVDDTGTVLTVPEDSLPQDITSADGKTVFFLFPNTQGAVKPGSKVAVTFGDVRLEPIVVQ
jgi:hypothetical protein